MTLQKYKIIGLMHIEVERVFSEMTLCPLSKVDGLKSIVSFAFSANTILVVWGRESQENCDGA